MPFVEGETIGSYRIIEQLGQGGMATVYKAYHPALDRYVAIKALHPAFKEDPNFLARFQREARVVAKLDHPNIVPIFDFAEHEGRPYLVIKYIEGETLKARMSRGPLRRDEISAVIESVGAGLAYAHRQGILHRDVKPSNVLLASDGSIFLADFGLARIAQAGESTISSDMMLGTPQYISPEQALGKRDLDEGTDIYSFGVLIYEMLVGKVPFSADTPYAIIHDHIYTALPLPSQENPSVPEAAQRQLLRALAKDRQDRFPDVPALVAAFRGAFAEDQVRVGEPFTALDAGLPEDETQAVPATVEPLQVSGPFPAAEPEQTSLPPSTPLPAAVVEKPRRPRKKRWLWIALPGTLLLCLCLALTARKVGKDRNISFPGGTPVIPPVTEVVNIQVPPKTDPYPHVDVALVFMDNGENEFAIRELQTAADLAGSDLGFYRAAGGRLIEAEEYLPAAWLFLHALAVTPDRPLDMVDAARQSVYMGYNDSRAPTYIPYEMVAGFDPVLRDVVEARFVYFEEDQPVKAQTLLARIVKDNPRYPEAHLLEAEIQQDQGNTDLAYKILQQLVESADTPPWIVKIATNNLP